MSDCCICMTGLLPVAGITELLLTALFSGGDQFLQPCGTAVPYNPGPSNLPRSKSLKLPFFSA